MLAALAAMLCLRAMGQEAPPCAIGGTVTDNANATPVERARVIAEGVSYSLLTLTDDHGHFCFSNLTGEYHLIVQKTGFSEVRHPVSLAVESDTPLKPLSIRLERYGSLSGTVLDAAGELLPGAAVTVYQRTRAGAGQVDDTATDANGFFHISQLPPGAYYLSAKLEEEGNRYALPFANEGGHLVREKDMETFYSGSSSLAGATPVEIKSGQPVDNLVLTLRKVHLRRVMGTAADLAHAGFLTYRSVTGPDGYGAIPIAKDGTFAKVDFFPSKYTLALTDGKKTVARKDVDLTSGDALNITLDPIETVDIPAVVRTEGKGPAFRSGAHSDTLVLFPDGSDEGSTLETSGDGTYRFPGIVRGIYRLELWGTQLFLKSVTYGGETQTEGKIDLRRDRPGGLEITLSSNVAEVQGKVALSADEADDLTVILVDGAHVVHQAHTDQKGRFRIPSVAPGKYRLFAIEDFDGDDWGNPELQKTLESKSVALELKENEKKQVSVPAISAGEWAAALKKLGG
jgi:hypothetical protein